MILKSIIPPNFVNDNRTRRCDTMAQDVLCEVTIVNFGLTVINVVQTQFM